MWISVKGKKVKPGQNIDFFRDSGMINFIIQALNKL